METSSLCLGFLISSGDPLLVSVGDGRLGGWVAGTFWLGDPSLCHAPRGLG